MTKYNSNGDCVTYDRTQMIADETEKLEKAIARRKKNGKGNDSITLNAINNLNRVDEIIDARIADLKRQAAYDLLKAGA